MRDNVNEIKLEANFIVREMDLMDEYESLKLQEKLISPSQKDNFEKIIYGYGIPFLHAY